MMPLHTFDLRQFSEVVYREAAGVFPGLLRDLGQERVYSLALYNSGDTWGYLSPTVSTFVGLESVARHYQALPQYSTFSLGELQCCLKWSPCDSPHHQTYADGMPETAAVIEPVTDLMYSLSEEEAAALHVALVDACMDVLKRLDRAGVFGTGQDRSNLVLNLLNGDQSDEERLERAGLLNSSAACVKLFGEFEAAARACKR